MKIKTVLIAFMLLLPALVLSQRNDKQGFYLQQFSSPKVTGCADYFYLSLKEKKQRQRFIFVNDHEHIAYIRIQGKTTTLIYKPGSSAKDATFGNDEYSVNLKILSRYDTGPDSFSLTAILTIYHKGKMIITKRIFGEGGC